MQSGQIAIGVERADELALRDRMIDPVGGVFLARLDELDRRSRHLLGDPHRVRHEFAASAPPEAAADQHGLIPGDVLYIYTGWGDNWKDTDTENFYYTNPCLSYDAAQYIADKQVVLLALDNPFTDPVADGFLQGKAPPPSVRRPAVCDPPHQPHPVWYLPDPEREPRSARQGQ